LFLRAQNQETYLKEYEYDPKKAQSYRNGSLTFNDNLSVVTKSEPVTPEVILKQSILIGSGFIKIQQLDRVGIAYPDMLL
jgi:hypothetical protein